MYINSMARPTKLTEKLIATFEEVVEEYILACTDEDIFTMLNDRLPEDGKICYTTFKNYKNKNLNDASPEDIELYKMFLSVIKKSLINQKQVCLDKLQGGGSGEWQKYAWIIERKFKEWNLKNISEVDHTTKGEKITQETPLTDKEKAYLADQLDKLDQEPPE